MITLAQHGIYTIVGTADHKTMLTLDGVRYLQSYAPKIGNLLTYAKREHTTDYLIARGNYRIYKVKDELHLVDLEHLELSIGRGVWQGYLLLTGLPTARKIRSRIIATDEVITGKKYHKKYATHH
jgi:hypothetical protein